MDEPRTEPPAWLPVPRADAPVAARRKADPDPDPDPDPAPGPPPPPRTRTRSVDWRRFVRTPRAAVGFGLLAAGLLLWPFSGFSWIPLLVGFGALVLVRVLRFDGLLRGWDVPVAGLVVVVGLMVSTSPWAWALAASIGVLIAGLLRLPDRRLVAAGAVLCVVSGVGFGFSLRQDAARADAEQAQAQSDSQATLGAPRPATVLPTLLSRISRNVPGPVCDNLLDPAAATAFTAASGAPTCADAVARLAAQVPDPTAYERGQAPTDRVTNDEWLVDACHLTWSAGAAAGPQLGHLVIGLKTGGRTYVVTSFQACTG